MTILLGTLGVAAGGCARAEETPSAAESVGWPPFARAPLDTPLVVTASFGEYRSGHFHAGLDFSTQQAVGRPVYAPAAGWVRRARASGAGYGRGLYFQADDGRLFVFGHLDAFAEPVRSRIAAIQDSAGEYDQDVTFFSNRYRYAAGDTIGWSGESGAGPPHLHMEVRRVDMAVHPLAAGLTVRDTLPPRLVRLTLDPLDDTSFVASPASGAVSLGSGDSSVVVARGRFRAVVEAFDPREDGAGKLAPFRTRVAEASGGGEAWFVEARFDSASWAGEMSEVDFVYDRGRATRGGGPALVLWAPPGFRPRVLQTSAPMSEEAGAITIAPGAAPRALAVSVADPSGHTTRRTVVLRGAEGPRPAPAAPRAGASSPPPDPGHAHVATRQASTLTFENGVRIDIPAEAMFVPETLRARVLTVPHLGANLQAVGSAIRITPDLTPLRSAVTVRIPVPPATAGGRRLGVVRVDRGDWTWLGGRVDTTSRTAVVDSRRFGTFALLRDVGSPRLGRFRVRDPRVPSVPYSRWAIEIRARDSESGIDTDHSYLVVNGKRVPTELDADAGALRWRPLVKPPPGSLRVEAIVADDAGNTARLAATLVVR